jgi:hypothetical protein
VVNVVPNYLSRNTSDHYPVSSKYKIIAGDTSVVVVNPPPPPPPPVVFTGFKVWPNPFTQSIIFRSGTNLTNITFTLYNSVGAKVWQASLPNIITQQFNEFQLPSLSSGMYVLEINSSQQKLHFKLVK